MTRLGTLRPSLFVVLALALGGCSQLSGEPEPEPQVRLAPALGTALPPPRAESGVPPGVEDSAPQIVITGPDGSVWSRDKDAGTAYDSDVEACYNYSRAQVEHDRMIESDAGSAFDHSASGSSLHDLTRQMSNFEQSNRQPALFQKCMETRGYARN